MGIRDERLSVALQMPHRAFAVDECLDTRLVSEIGRLFFRGLLTKAQYDAGVRYGNIVLSYLATTDAPEPFGGDDLHRIEDEECLRRKLDMAAAREVLRLVDRKSRHIVDRVAVYDHGIDDDQVSLLINALDALAGRGSDENA